MPFLFSCRLTTFSIFFFSHESYKGEEGQRDRETERNSEKLRAAERDRKRQGRTVKDREGQGKTDRDRE